jgi:hypothetical protein
MEPQGDAAHIRGGEPLTVPVELDVVAADRAELGCLDVNSGTAKGPQKRAFLANCVHRHVTHTWGMSGSFAG